MSRLPISSLILSPPETEILHTFDFTTPTSLKMAEPRENTPQDTDVVMSEPEPTTKHTPKADPARQRPMSPPESPISASRQQRDFVKPQSRLSLVVDPTVVPLDQDENEDPLPAPGKDDVLFPPIRDSVDAAIQHHIKTNAVHYMRGKSKGDTRTLRYQMPTVDEYRLAVPFLLNLGKQNSAEYLRRTREENNQYYPQSKKLGKGPTNFTHIEAKPITLAVPRPQASRVLKPASPRKPTTPRVRPVSRSGESPRSGARSGIPHVRHREPKKPADDKYWLVDDKSPSADILNNNPKALRIDWDGNPLDLSNDPDRNLLHEAEYNLSSALRLTCARYLTCKRRIFNARVEALRIGKEFKKTDAQQACQIDVNKASKLWLAYEKAGWLQPQLFKQYL